MIAFQQWEGRPVTGRLTIAELEAIRTSASPKAREPGYAHVEVDLDRQVLLVVNAGFKDAIYSKGIEEAWYEFRKAELERIAIEWLQEEGIPYSREDATKVSDQAM